MLIPITKFFFGANIEFIIEIIVYSIVYFRKWSHIYKYVIGGIMLKSINKSFLRY